MLKGKNFAVLSANSTNSSLKKSLSFVWFLKFKILSQVDYPLVFLKIIKKITAVWLKITQKMGFLILISSLSWWSGIAGNSAEVPVTSSPFSFCYFTLIGFCIFSLSSCEKYPVPSVSLAAFPRALPDVLILFLFFFLTYGGCRGQPWGRPEHHVFLIWMQHNCSEYLY